MIYPTTRSNIPRRHESHMSERTREGKVFIHVQQVRDIVKTYEISANFHFVNLPEHLTF